MCQISFKSKKLFVDGRTDVRTYGRTDIPPPSNIIRLTFGSRPKNAQRRRKHCALAEVRRSQTISPRRRPRSRGARDGQNLISWRWSLPLPTNPVWRGSMHAISSYRGNRPTNKHTHKHTNPQTGPITIHCAAALVAACLSLLTDKF